MALTNCRLGQFIELCNDTNADLSYGIDDVRGVNNLKQLMSTKADLNGRDLSKFQIVKPGEFVFNHRTSRNGSKFSIAYNDGNNPVICTEDYVVFKLTEKGKEKICARWLYIFFNRPEFDRYVITNSWGSSTEFYNWEDITSVELNLPPLSIQQKYVDVYNSMFANQQSYERGLEDLKFTVDTLLDKYKKSESKVKMANLLEEIDNRNTDNQFEYACGVNITKQFMPSVASSSDLHNYKIVTKNQFVFSGMQTGRDECIRIALLTDDTSLIVSPAYTVFKIKSDNVIPEYIQMWFSRSETDRYGWFLSDASIRTNLDLECFYGIEIPLPDYSSQMAIVNIYKAYTNRRKINEQLKTQIKNICPILIKGSIEEARK